MTQHQLQTHSVSHTNRALKNWYKESPILDNLVSKRVKERQSNDRNKRKYFDLLLRSKSPRYVRDRYEDEHRSSILSNIMMKGNIATNLVGIGLTMTWSTLM